MTDLEHSSWMEPDSPTARTVATARLLADIAANPRAHEFFATLRRIECLHPEQPLWGRASRPSQEPIRLSQDAELDFAPAALSGLDLKARPVPRLGVRFFGLFGSQGPMPLHLTEYVRERSRFHGDPTIARFCDIFHHRLLSFFYRAWAEGQPAVHLDRVEGDRYSSWLGSAFGFDGRRVDQGSVSAAAQLFQTGLLASRSRHPEGLAKILSDFFGVRAAIDENVPQWLAIARDDRSRLGFARHRGERFGATHSQLGRSATSGTKAYDRQFKFRVVLGPLKLKQYQSFLPNGTAWPALREWVAQYAGFDLRWEVRLVLARLEIPKARLGRGQRLGMTTWIGRGHRTRDRSDLTLRSESSSLARSRGQGSDPQPMGTSHA